MRNIKFATLLAFPAIAAIAIGALATGEVRAQTKPLTCSYWMPDGKTKVSGAPSLSQTTAMANARAACKKANKNKDCTLFAGCGY